VPASASKETWRFGVNGSRTAGALHSHKLFACSLHAVGVGLIFSQAFKSRRSISHVLGRALQLHPRHVQFWIDAASWEFEVNGNSNAARVLLQRGIRFNS
jgi:hypothetical protein